MESILASAVASTCDGADDLVGALERWLPRFQAELSDRTQSESEILWKYLLDAGDRLKVPLEVTSVKLGGSADALLSMEGRRLANESFDKLVSESEISNCAKALENKITQTQPAVEAMTEANKKAIFGSIDIKLRSCDSILDSIPLEHKLRIAANVAPHLKDPEWGPAFTEIRDKIVPFLVSPPDNQLDLLDEGYPLLPPSVRTKILLTAEGWLNDRIGSSNEVKKIVEKEKRRRGRINK